MDARPMRNRARLRPSIHARAAGGSVSRLLSGNTLLEHSDCLNKSNRFNDFRILATWCCWLRRWRYATETIVGTIEPARLRSVRAGLGDAKNDGAITTPVSVHRGPISPRPSPNAHEQRSRQQDRRLSTSGMVRFQNDEDEPFGVFGARLAKGQPSYTQDESPVGNT
jgi:hypothetical protein